MDEQILDALRFYADPRSYCSGHNGPEVMRVQGSTAIAALNLAEQDDGRSGMVESTLREILGTMPIPAPYQAGRPAYERARQLLGMDRGDR